MGNTTLIDYLNDIARAVQAKTKKTNKIKLKDLADEIDGIDSLATHEFANNATNPLTINSNGEYNIFDNDFSHIVVDIPFAGDDLAPYFQNQTGAGPYTMVYYNHMLPGMLPGGEVEEADPVSESEEVSEVGYDSYDFNIGDGGVAFLTYEYNSSSHIYTDHSVSFYKHNLGNGEILARENYHLTGNSGDRHYSDITLVDLTPGSSAYPAVYFNSSGYLLKGNDVATPGYVSWRNDAYSDMTSMELANNEFVYKNTSNISIGTLPKGNSGDGWITVAHLGTGSDNYIRTQRMNSGRFYYIDSNCSFNNTGSALAAYYNNSTDSVNSLDSSDDDKVLYYNSSSQYFEANSLSDSEILYNATDGSKEIGSFSYNSPVGIYTYRYDSGSEGVYLQRLSDQNGFNRILVGADYNSTSFQTYNCMVDRALYFTVSSGKTYINSLDLNRHNITTECSIIIPSIVSTPYAYNFNSNVIPSLCTNTFNNYSHETHTANVYAKKETLTHKNIAYLTTGTVGGTTVAYGAVTDLYDTNYSISTPSKDALSIIKVAYYSTDSYKITASPIYDNNVLKAYHLGINASDEYCVTSTNLSYSYSSGATGYTNNFITLLYPKVTHPEYGSDKEKASIEQLTVTPNRYYTLKEYNGFSSIADVDISPIKLGTTTPTYNWTAPADGENPTSSKVFGYIRVYQFTDGDPIDVPVTYEMITALANAGLIDTNYNPPVAA